MEFFGSPVKPLRDNRRVYQNFSILADLSRPFCNGIRYHRIADLSDSCGSGGIRTHGALASSRFPGVCNKPLCDTSLINRDEIVSPQSLNLDLDFCGDPSPSRDDLPWTDRVSGSCDLLGLKLVDHLIEAGDKHYSLKEQGDLRRSS